jgi:hypothetical protein
MARVRSGREEGGHPYLAVTFGLLIFQVIALIPFIGGTVAVVTDLVGDGAFVYRTWSALRGTATSRAVAVVAQVRSSVSGLGPACHTRASAHSHSQDADFGSPVQMYPGSACRVASGTGLCDRLGERHDPVDGLV